LVSIIPPGSWPAARAEKHKIMTQMEIGRLTKFFILDVFMAVF